MGKDPVIEIVEYESKYKDAFKALNLAWIKKYFKVEEADSLALDDPEGYIINKGGTILFVKVEGEVVGVCALQKMNHEKYDFELAKMAISPKYHGLGLGAKLGNAVIEKAKFLGATHIFLESNTILEPAINLYKKLGFLEIFGIESPYERSNIQMELTL